MKRLGRKQIFDIFVGIMMQVYCLFPWIPMESGKINIFTYLYLYIKNGEHFKMFQSVFLKYGDSLQYLSEDSMESLMVQAESVAYYFLAALAVMVVVQLLNLLYAVFSVKEYSGIILLSYVRIAVFLFLVGIVGNAFQGGAFLYEWENRVYIISGSIFIYLGFFLAAEIMLLLMGNSLKESEQTARLLEEERRKAQLHYQRVMENYIYNLERMVDELRAFQHDYKNIMSTMSGYIRENQMDELRDFFSEKIQSASSSSEMQMKAWQALRNIRPMELKGFLYEKMLLIMAHKLNAQVDISENLDVKYNDMEELIRILGIFIDNAVEEAGKTSDRKIGIVIARTRGGILFRIENNFTEKPVISRLAEKGYSTKGESRGIGLYWVEERINSHEDMFHELKVTDEKFIQILEIVTL